MEGREEAYFGPAFITLHYLISYLLSTKQQRYIAVEARQPPQPQLGKGKLGGRRTSSCVQNSDMVPYSMLA